MALCSLLIETLHQFYNGLDVTVFRGHKEAFVQFLTRSNYFGSYFTRRTASFFIQILEMEYCIKRRQKEILSLLLNKKT